MATSLLGKPVLDERLPFHTGVLGEVGTPAAAELMGGCDTLLLVGTNDPWTDYFPMPGQARTVQIDIDGRRIGTRYPVDVPLVGDAPETLRALLARVRRPARPRSGGPPWRARSTGGGGGRGRRAAAPAEPVNPQLVLHELSARLPRPGAVAVDVGSVIYWYARHLELPPGRQRATLRHARLGGLCPAVRAWRPSWPPRTSRWSRCSATARCSSTGWPS